jgi:hypothetical protein
LRTVKDVFSAQKTKQFKVKPNLWEALRHLRRVDADVALWVDAICINQFDEKEKNDQVSKMGFIYSRAYNVHVWLGSEHADADNTVSDLAMEFIPQVSNYDLHPELLENQVHVQKWASLYEFLRWSW